MMSHASHMMLHASHMMSHASHIIPHASHMMSHASQMIPCTSQMILQVTEAMQLEGDWLAFNLLECTHTSSFVSRPPVSCLPSIYTGGEQQQKKRKERPGSIHHMSGQTKLESKFLTSQDE